MHLVVQSSTTGTIKLHKLAPGCNSGVELCLERLLLPAQQVVLRAAEVEHWHGDVGNVIVDKALQPQHLLSQRHAGMQHL